MSNETVRRLKNAKFSILSELEDFSSQLKAIFDMKENVIV